ncbi:MAG: nucleotide exchange factor GrpE [Ekhidna sp.]|nr:nucleotide exchange factor GrpE [Ekhidna sp.]MBC6425471.1 nucleotide exchange factor GrpE [Ekhidna sp.]
MSKKTKEKKAKKEKKAEDQETQILEQEEVDNQENGDSLIEDELSEAKDKYLRLYSEFENFRRRTAKEKLDLISTANKDLMSELVPVLDDFERAITASDANEDFKTLKEGISLVHNKLNKILNLKGLKKMDVKKGDAFDDEEHEAITQIPANKKLEGKVVDVVEAGYTLGETVVRFAKVVVGAKQ